MLYTAVSPAVLRIRRTAVGKQRTAVCNKWVDLLRGATRAQGIEQLAPLYMGARGRLRGEAARNERERQRSNECGATGSSAPDYILGWPITPLAITNNLCLSRIARGKNQMDLSSYLSLAIGVNAPR